MRHSGGFEVGIFRFRIDQHPVLHLVCRRSQTRKFNFFLAQDVKNGLAGRNEIIRNDATVTAPPDRLGAHDGATGFVTKVSQPPESALKLIRRSVIRVIPEAYVVPKSVLRSDLPLL